MEVDIYMKFNKRIVTVILSLVMIFGIVSPVLAYDHGAAQRYADKYVLSPNTNYNFYNDNDCANFVSQCLTEGGLPWVGSRAGVTGWAPYLSTWTTANGLKTHMKEYLGATLLGRWRKTAGYNSHGIYYYGYVNNSNNIAGWGSEVVFYDWTDDGHMDHAAIVVGTNSPFYSTNTGITSLPIGDLIDAHSNPRKHQYWHLDAYNAQRNTTAIYAYRLK